MKKRKLVALFMAISMVLCSMPTVAIADVAVDPRDVTVQAVESIQAVEANEILDMPAEGYWSTEALKAAVSNGLLNGFPEKGGTYIKPDDPLTRAQMATIVNRAFGSKETASISGTSDVLANSWYYKDIQKAVKMGTIKLVGKMRPKDNVTRQEAFTILARALKMKDGTMADLVKFNDAPQVNSWAIAGMGAMVKAGYIKGDNNLLTPTASMTRAQFAVIMNNVIKKYISTSGTVSEVVAGNVMVNAPDVTLQDVTITGDLIIGDGVGDGTISLKNVIVEGDLVARGGGVDSIIITGGSVNGKVIIAKIDGKIRVFAEGGAEINAIEVDDGKDDVIIEGTVGTIEVNAPDTPIIVQNATVKNIEVKTEGASNITVDNKSKVDSIVVGASSTGTKVDVSGTVANFETSAPGTELSGTGTVINAKANEGAANSKIAIPTVKVINDGAINLRDGNGDIISITPKSSTSSRSRVETPVVQVSNISLNKAEMMLVVGGDAGILEAAVEPGNATNKTVTWSSENVDIATVAGGVVTPLATGQAIITATAGGKTAEIAVVVSEKRVANITTKMGYDTIAEAINAAEDGDTIEVAEGTYTEALNFRADKNGNVSGAAQNLTIKAAGDVTIKNPEPNAIEIGFNVDKNMGTITIDGFKIYDFENGISQGHSYGQGTIVHALNNEIWADYTGTMKNAIQVAGDHSVVKGNTIHAEAFVEGWQSTAITVINAEDVIVEDNLIKNNVKIGINVNSYGGSLAKNITLKNNTIRSAKNGIQISSQGSGAPFTIDGLTVEGNNITHSADETNYGVNIQKVNLTNCSFDNNTITDGFTYTLRISSSATIDDVKLNGEEVVLATGVRIKWASGGNYPKVGETLTAELEPLEAVGSVYTWIYWPNPWQIAQDGPNNTFIPEVENKYYKVEAYDKYGYLVSSYYSGGYTVVKKADFLGESDNINLSVGEEYTAPVIRDAHGQQVTPVITDSHENILDEVSTDVVESYTLTYNKEGYNELVIKVTVG